MNTCVEGHDCVELSDVAVPYILVFCFWLIYRTLGSYVQVPYQDTISNITFLREDTADDRT
jgi:hypothetical protein